MSPRVPAAGPSITRWGVVAMRYLLRVAIRATPRGETRRVRASPDGEWWPCAISLESPYAQPLAAKRGGVAHRFHVDEAALAQDFLHAGGRGQLDERPMGDGEHQRVGDRERLPAA